jgi:hypothetical protein
LLGLKPASNWKDAANPLMGIIPMMDFFQEHYGKKYAPNTHEDGTPPSSSPVFASNLDCS